MIRSHVHTQAEEQMKILSRIATLCFMVLPTIGLAMPAAPVQTETATEGLNFPAGTDQQQVLDGWIGLFDGKTTFGWTAKNPQYWKVDSSTGELQTYRQGKAELLRTTAQLSLIHI